jgi:DNA mismatch repair protein PMS2
LDIIEVSDNGVGVPVACRPFLALPHATSKLRAWDDLYRAQDGHHHTTTNHEETSDTQQRPLGFRGEALFALAHVCQSLVILTRTADQGLAQKMEFGRDGVMRPESVSFQPRKVGTTVAAVRLWDALPVRRADLKRRLPAQRKRLVRLLRGYAIFGVGVQFHLMEYVPQSQNAASGGGATDYREQTLLATPAQTRELAHTISAVLGAKFLTPLAPIAVDLSGILVDDDDVETAYPVAAASRTPTRRRVCHMQGYLSKAPHAASANAKRERGLRPEHFFCINGRPVDLPKVARLLNEAWRSLTSAGASRGQSMPSCVLVFTLPNHCIDVNVSADKREVQFAQEAKLLELVQEGVLRFWQAQSDGQFTAAPLSLSVAAPQSPPQPSQGGLPPLPAGAMPPGRFNRRYAFSHDVKSIRLQHEFDDGRQKHGDEVLVGREMDGSDAQDVEESGTETLPNSFPEHDGTQQVLRHDDETGDRVQTPAKERTDDARDATEANAKEDEDSRSRKKQRTSLAVSVTDSEATVLAHNVTPSPVATKPTLTLHLPELSALSPPTPESEQKLWRRARRRFNQVSSDHSDQGEEEDEADHTAQEKESGAKGSGPGGAAAARRTTFLNQFRSSRASSTKHTNATSQPIDDSASHRLERFGFRTEQVTKKGTEQEKAEGEGSAAQKSPQSPSCAPEEERPRRRKVSFPPSTVENPNDVMAEQETANKEVCWDGFGSTQAIADAARTERLRMRDRKRSLREIESRAVPDAAEGIISLNKGDFESMEVIGQFNMGFIVAKSRDSHLWILDQHACDEKYNFEKLCQETVINEQRLIAPMPLELSSSEESCILEHMDIFEKNGFRFNYDPSQPPRHRFSLIGLPHSGARNGRKAVQFGKDDVSALCAVLSGDESHGDEIGGGTGADGSGMYGNNAVRRYAGRGNDTSDRIIARLPKAVAMFASRACRSSIMIGKALSHQEMDKVVKKLEHVEHPWNCPHGRPTMRHLGDLTAVLADDERKVTETIGNATVTLLSQEEEEC